jgi:hypothetical protein
VDGSGWCRDRPEARERVRGREREGEREKEKKKGKKKGRGDGDRVTWGGFQRGRSSQAKGTNRVGRAGQDTRDVRCE